MYALWAKSSLQSSQLNILTWKVSTSSSQTLFYGLWSKYSRYWIQMLQFGLSILKLVSASVGPTALSIMNQQYKGEGVQVSWGDCNKHTKDDKLLLAKECLSSPSGWTCLPTFGRIRGSNTRSNPSTSTPQDASRSDHEAQANWIDLIEKEILWLSEAPITSHTVPLVFVSEPPVHSKFTWPSTTEILWPNWGARALRVGHHMNNAFLMSKNCLYELVSLIGTIEHSEDLLALTQKLHAELICLNHEKVLQ